MVVKTNLVPNSVDGRREDVFLVFEAGQTTSKLIQGNSYVDGGFPVYGATVFGFTSDANFPTAAITFQQSSNNSTFTTISDISGIDYSLTLSPSHSGKVDPAIFYGVDFLKVILSDAPTQTTFLRIDMAAL